MKHIAYFILMLTLFAICQDDFKTSELIIPDIPKPLVIVESSIIDKITDLDGTPLSDTEVILAGETLLQNELEYVQFDGLQLDRFIFSWLINSCDKTVYLQSNNVSFGIHLFYAKLKALASFRIFNLTINIC